MKKEVPTTKKPEYKYAGKETLTEIIGKALPRQLIPTKRMGAIFGFLFLLALILAIFQFPLSELIAGEANVSITIGFPYPFLDFGLTDVEQSPIRTAGFAIDLILYLFIAYAIDILISVAIKNPLIGTKEQAEKKPTTFKDQKSKSISETITKKILEKQIPKKIPQNQKPNPNSPQQAP
jgi:hypothetical protein